MFVNVLLYLLELKIHIVCNYNVNRCFWNKIHFSFMRLLPLFGQVTFLHVVSLGVKFLNQGVFRGVIFK